LSKEINSFCKLPTLPRGISSVIRVDIVTSRNGVENSSETVVK